MPILANTDHGGVLLTVRSNATRLRCCESYAMSQGFTITDETTSRTLLMASASTATFRSAFRWGYVKSHGFRQLFHTPRADPAVPASIAPREYNIIGLDTSLIAKPAHRAVSLDCLILALWRNGIRRYIRASRLDTAYISSSNTNGCRTETVSLSWTGTSVGRNSVQFRNLV